MSHPLSSGRHSTALARSGPATAVISVHLLIAYVLSVSMGVIQAPEFAQPLVANFIPEPHTRQPQPPPPKDPVIKNVLDPIVQPMPVIAPEDPVIPVAQVPIPPSQNATEATATPPAQPPAVAQSLKVSRRVDPTYPPSARRAGEEGSVQLRILVDERGLPGEVQITKSSGFARLDQAAIEAVRRWRFVAATHGSQPVVAWTQVAITFRLTGANG